MRRHNRNLNSKSTVFQRRAFVFGVFAVIVPAAFTLAISSRCRAETAVTIQSTAPSLPASSASPSIATERLYDIDANQTDIAMLLRTLSARSHTNLVLLGNVSGFVTVRFSQEPLERAMSLVAEAGGFTVYQDGDAFVVGSSKDVTAAYPTRSPDYPTDQQVYLCKYVDAYTLATTISTTFDKSLLHVTVGADEVDPSLNSSSSSSASPSAPSTSTSSSTSTNSTSSTSSPTSSPSSSPSAPSIGSSGGGSTTVNPGLVTRVVVIYGAADLVKEAMDLAAKLDRRRKQVKIDVSILDVDTDGLKNLGLQWAFSGYDMREKTPAEEGVTAYNGINIGEFTHDPVSFDATITALENTDQAKLLADPSLSLLDGEQGYILIGQRVLFPELTGYSETNAPIYSVDTENVGILLQVAVQIDDDGEITMNVYPQVSTVTGYLNVDGASYPQISTREQQTTIRVPDGHKIIIGGLINDQVTASEQSVPLLSSIPFFGELFKYRSTTRAHSDVIVTITPTITDD
jgi:general secretion pathway protein D